MDFKKFAYCEKFDATGYNFNGYKKEKVNSEDITKKRYIEPKTFDEFDIHKKSRRLCNEVIDLTDSSPAKITKSSCSVESIVNSKKAPTVPDEFCPLYKSPTQQYERPLRLLIVGQNPSEMSWTLKHHYANPANRMWSLLG